MKVVVRKYSLPNGRYSVLFRGDPENLDVSEMGTVCLSRNKPGACNYPLNELEEHDYHAPPFSTQEGAEVYAARVKQDIRDILVGKGYEVTVVEEGGFLGSN